MAKFKYLSGLCGAGKTHVVIDEIKSRPQEKHLYLAPTRHLAKQTASAIKGSHLITSDTVPNVLAAVVDAAKDINTSGYGVIVMTHAGFESTPVRLFRKGWVCWVDEKLTIDTYAAPALPRNHHILTNHFEIASQESGDWYRVSLKNPKAAAKFVENQKKWNDDVDGIVAGMVQSAVNHDEVLINKKDMDKILAGDLVHDEGDTRKNKIRMLSFRTPYKFQQFKEITFLHANCESGMMFRTWQRRYGVQWKPSFLTRKLRYQQHDGSKLTIVALSDERLSKLAFRFEDETGKNGIQVMIDKIVDDLNKRGLANEKVAYVVNNEFKDSVGVPDTWRQMPVLSHGSNRWMDYSIVVHLTALNRQPSHIGSLQYVGVSDDDLQQESNDVCYQGILRSSFRNPNSDKPVLAYVGNMQQAKFIGGRAPESTILSLFDQTQYVVKPISGADRKVRDRCKKSLINQRLSKKLLYYGFGQFFEDTAWTIFNSKNDVNGTALHCKDYAAIFDAWLLSADKYRCSDKNHLMGVCPVAFSGKRGTKNVSGKSIFFIADFDGGSIETVTKYLTDTKQRAVITTTASHTPDDPHFRVLLPLSRPVDADGYQAVWNQLDTDLVALGVDTLDPACAKQYQVAYLPATVAGKKPEVIKINLDSDFTFDVDRAERNSLVVPEDQNFELVQILDELEAQPDAEKRRLCVLQKIDGLIADMSPGNRSYLACRIGGILGATKHVLLESDIWDINSRVIGAGIGAEALKSYNKYSKQVA